MPFVPGLRPAARSVANVLIRLSDAAERLDQAALPRVLDRLTRLDRAAAALLLPVLVVCSRALRVLVDRPADRFATVVADWVLPPSASTGDGSRPQHRRPVTRRLRPLGEIAAVSMAVLLVGVMAASADVRPAAPVETAVQAAATSPDRPGLWSIRAGEHGAARPEARPAPAEPEVAAPRPAPPAAHAAPAEEPVAAPEPHEAAPERWLPTGTGMWVHEWARTEGGNARAVVERAQASGFSHLYVQTGSTKKGWIGDDVLAQILPATKGTDIKVIAWDFPKLIDPVDDARRTARGLYFRRDGVPTVAAVAPDVETAAEGTHLSPEAVDLYYRTLRAELPPEIAILATVPWPSEKRTASYPYAQTAAFSDAFVPMAYWYNRPPDVVTATSMTWLAQFGLPVMPAGQGYDGRLDAPYLPPDPDPGGSVQRFVDTARAHGAQSISLWSWQTTGAPQWDALARAGAAPWPAVR